MKKITPPDFASWGDKALMGRDNLVFSPNGDRLMKESEIINKKTKKFFVKIGIEENWKHKNGLAWGTAFYFRNKLCFIKKWGLLDDETVVCAIYIPKKNGWYLLEQGEDFEFRVTFDKKLSVRRFKILVFNGKKKVIRRVKVVDKLRHKNPAGKV